ncbi:putative metallophosphoesterase [Oceanobacillus picturae]|uniref:Metallophosphoesterase n=1 Tax=Oceanobacillus picturae TaxID=171693 RepID=W9AFQ0_9BACI|nr:metallophosphoesterase [Oceanobacillus picturae]CDO04539.1 putative metallophosphoesterase [Oceanobacillus picturae]
MKKILRKWWLYVLIGIVLLIVFFYYQNNSIVISKHTKQSDNLPEVFDGYKIVQLSDLHNKSFGDDQSYLVEKIKKAEPDIIVFTGDVIDSRRYDVKPSIKLMEKIVDIAPVYYVTGNHEWRSQKFNSLEEKLKNTGVHVMRNATEEITLGSEKIRLIGVDDPSHNNGIESDVVTTGDYIESALKDVDDEETFQVLLSHRPELLSLYSKYGIDLVFSGHAHGGQVRIPFIGGLIAPNQGLLPMYTSGEHIANDTTMIVNRGLGNSLFPLRVFNRPEIVVVTLRTDE